MNAKYPCRIVSLQPSITLTLVELGAADRLVACTKYCIDVCPEITRGGCAIVNDSWTADASQILRNRPDLIIASVPYQEKAVIEILKTGVPFLGFAPHTLQDIYNDVALLGAIVNARDEAAQQIANFQSLLDSVRAKVQSASSQPLVFCEEWGKPIIASQPWVAELVSAAGGRPLGAAGKQITADEVRDANPDVILAAWCGAGDRVPLDKIVRERHWGHTNAARANRVYCVPDEWLNTPALTTLANGLRAIARAVHPESFEPVPRLRQIANAPTAAR